MKDIRDTNAVHETFYKQIVELFEQKQKAGILYEDNGVTRANGMITALFEKDGKHFFCLDDNPPIDIANLYAVNGKFSSDYSEC
jgi:hypothetical protein